MVERNFENERKRCWALKGLQLQIPAYLSKKLQPFVSCFTIVQKFFWNLTFIIIVHFSTSFFLTVTVPL